MSMPPSNQISSSVFVCFCFCFFVLFFSTFESRYQTSILSVFNDSYGLGLSFLKGPSFQTPISITSVTLKFAINVIQNLKSNLSFFFSCGCMLYAQSVAKSKECNQHKLSPQNSLSRGISQVMTLKWSPKGKSYHLLSFLKSDFCKEMY